MKTISEFQKMLSEMLSHSPVSKGNLKQFYDELNDYIYSPAYERLSFGEKEQVQEMFDSVQSLMGSEKKTDNQTDLAASGTNKDTQENNSDFSSSNEPLPSSQHNDEAEKLINDAEEHFYSGRYSEAIRVYEQVLVIEPTWERARDHLDQAREYLRSGDIPSVALPSEAAINYGKAQSAVRVGRYSEALQLFNYAKEALTKNGIKKWKDGQEFEVRLEALIQAEEVAKEAVENFNHGRVDEAIQLLDNVYKETNIPRHKDMAEKYRNFKTVQQRITDIFFASNTAPPDMIIQAAQDMEKLSAEFEGNPSLQALRTKFDLIKPGLTGILRQEVRNLKTQADRSQDMDTARVYATDAKNRISLAVRLGLTDGMFNAMSREILQLIGELDSYQQDLETAENLIVKNRGLPKEAWDISLGVRRRYPNDPSVTRLNKTLSNYRYLRIILRSSIVLFILCLLISVGIWSLEKVTAYRQSLIPTATLTPTSTATATPTNTPTPTATPIPVTGRVTRRVWARNGCYENFTYTGSIPEGATVKLLPTGGDRRFDPLNRECILVEYKGANTSTSIIGWILIQDFEP